MLPVEFLDGDGSPAPDEEELETGTRRSRGWRSVPIAALVVVLAVLFWRSLASRDDGQVARPALPTPVGSTSFKVGWPPFPPPTSAAELHKCPKTVLCSRLTSLPKAALSGVREYLPGARVDSVDGIEYVSPYEHRVVVWFREIHLTVGDARIEVIIQQPRPTDMNSEAAYVLGFERVVRLRRVFEDRVVAIAAEGQSGTPRLAVLRSLAADVRLLAA